MQLKITLQGKAFYLPADFNISLVWENPLFLTDRIPAPHTIDFEIPPNHHNLEMLAFPNRLNANTRNRTYDGVQIQFGPVVLLQGALIVVRYEKNIRLRIRGFILTDLLRKPLTDASLEYIDLGDDSAGLDFDDSESYAYEYKQLITSAANGNENFTCAPVRYMEENWPLIEENRVPFASGIPAMYSMYVNFYNSRKGNFFIQGAFEKFHSSCFPSPRLHFVIDQIFEGRLQQNLFSSGELTKLILFNYYHPKFLSESYMNAVKGIIADSERPGAIGTPYHFWVELANYNSSLLSNDILKEIFKMFCITLFPLGNEFMMAFNDNIFSDPSAIDWTHKLIGDLANQTEPAGAYNYGYTDYDEEGELIGVNSYNNIKQLHDLTLSEEGPEAEYFINTTNQLIKKELIDKYEETDPDTYKYEVLRSGFAGKKNNEDAEGESMNMVSDIAPLTNNVHSMWYDYQGDQADPSDPIEPLDMGKWYVPEMDVEKFIKPEKPFVMIYHGFKDSFDGLTNLGTGEFVYFDYPFLSGHNYDGFGNRLGDLSLQWEGDDGLLMNYHQEFKAWVEKERLRIEGLFALEALDLKNLQLNKKRHVKGKNFYIEKLEVTIHLNRIDPARVSLIEA